MTIYDKVTLNPDISQFLDQTDNTILSARQKFINQLINQAKNFVVSTCHFNSYPEASKGYCKGGSDPSTNLTALDTNTILIGVDGYSNVQPHHNLVGFMTISLDLSKCSTGNTTAAELQSKIRALWNTTNDYRFKYVTVVYIAESSLNAADDHYLVTSGTYGTQSSIWFNFQPSEPDVAEAMKISPLFGATLLDGNFADPEIDDCTVQIAVDQFRVLRTVASGYDGKETEVTPIKVDKLSPIVMSVLLAKARPNVG